LFEKCRIAVDLTPNEDFLEFGGGWNEFERAVRDDDAVPGGCRGAGQKSVALVLGEIGFVRDEDSGVGIEE